jgi:hypothetical protein
MRSYYKGVARDQYGAIISSASIAIYLAGTTTVASVYTVSTGGTAVDSVTSDAEGIFYFYVDTSDYSNIQLFKLVISHLGNTSTYDNISVFYYDNYYIDALGEYGSGTVYTQATIESALTAIGTVNKVALLLRPGNWVLTSDLTIPANITLKLPAGAIITIPTGKTLTINGPFEAGLYQVFDCVGTGAVDFSAAIISEVYVEWWGVDGTADEVEWNKAILAAGSNKIVGASLQYNLSDTIDFCIKNQTIETLPQSLFMCTTDIQPILFRANHLNVSNIYVMSTSIPTTKAGIKLFGVQVSEFYNLRSYGFLYSMEMYSETDGLTYPSTSSVSYNNFYNISLTSTSARTKNALWIHALGPGTADGWNNTNHFHGGDIRGSYEELIIIGSASEYRHNGNTFSGMNFEGGWAGSGGKTGKWLVKSYGINEFVGNRIECECDGFYFNTNLAVSIASVVLGNYLDTNGTNLFVEGGRVLFDYLNKEPYLVIESSPITTTLASDFLTGSSVISLTSNRDVVPGQIIEVDGYYYHITFVGVSSSAYRVETTSSIADHTAGATVTIYHSVYGCQGYLNSGQNLALTTGKRLLLDASYTGQYSWMTRMSGTAGRGIQIVSEYLQSASIHHISKLHDFTTGATNSLFSIPKSSIVLGVTYRMTEGITTAGLTSIDIGVATAADRYIDNGPIALGSTGDLQNASAGYTSPFVAPGGQSLIVTANGANFEDGNGQMVIDAWYIKLTAASINTP